MKRWQFWVGILISLFFLYIALRGLQLGEMWQSIRAANLLWIIPAIVVFFVGKFLRSVRWKFMLQSREKTTTPLLFLAIVIGYFGNNVFPARAGDILRTIVLKNRAKVPISESLASIILERIFDGVVMLGFVLLNIGIFSKRSLDAQLTQYITVSANIAAIVFAALFLFFLLIAFFPQFALRIIRFVIQKTLPEKWREKVMEIAEQFFDGLLALSSPLMVLFLLVLSVVVWANETVAYWFVMQAFAFEVQFVDLLLLCGVLNLITSIPSAPGYIGTFDAPGIAIMIALGLNPELAAGYILTLHAVLWLPVTIIGGYFFIKEGLQWTQNQSLQEIERENQ